MVLIVFKSEIKKIVRERVVSPGTQTRKATKNLRAVSNL